MLPGDHVVRLMRQGNGLPGETRSAHSIRELGPPPTVATKLPWLSRFRPPSEARVGSWLASGQGKPRRAGTFPFLARGPLDTGVCLVPMGVAVVGQARGKTVVTLEFRPSRPARVSRSLSCRDRLSWISRIPRAASPPPGPPTTRERASRSRKRGQLKVPAAHRQAVTGARKTVRRPNRGIPRSSVGSRSSGVWGSAASER